MDAIDWSNVWQTVHPAIQEQAKDIAESGKFDDAILAALRYVESEIQGRIGSTSIGQALLNEAFDGPAPKIQIGGSRDVEWVKSIFSGAFGFVRNDRAHKAVPALPCGSIDECNSFLQFAGFLLRLLDRDKALLPNIASVEVVALSDRMTVGFHGAQLTRIDKVVGSGQSFRATLQRADLAEFELSPGFAGELDVFSGADKVHSVHVDGRPIGTGADNIYEVIDANIPLYEDVGGKLRRLDCTGFMVEANEGGKVFLRIQPTRGTYKKGQYVSHGPFEFDRPAIGKTWFRSANGEILPAWDSSVLAAPNILGERGKGVVSNLGLFPNVVSLSVGEIRTLSAQVVETDGSIRRNVSTSGGVWNSQDEQVAHVGGGILRAKSLGKTRVDYIQHGFKSSIDVRVEDHVHGDKSIYFESLYRPQSIRFDSADDLYFCDQSSSIFKLKRNGGVETVLRIPKPDLAPFGVDCIAIDKNGGIYANNIHQGAAFYFRRDGARFGAGNEIGRSVEGTKKGMVTTNSGDLFVTVMQSKGGCVLHVHPDGVETTFSLRGSAHVIGIGPDGHLYVAPHRARSIDVYEQDGRLIDTIELAVEGPVGDLSISADGTIYVAMFGAGQLLKLTRSPVGFQQSVVATDLGSPTGVSLDSQGRACVSDLSSGRIYLVY
ncbi:MULTISPECIES: TIGR02391 family protein [unclassified Burkholderia]|uniref:TIGR02391 family protein n=1 Tax=unclassified Burkholderia TaxID=2613784 RepID=UPI000F5A2891|nr:MULTISPECIES: TIGR02391 family protein [unclassified Burkholderia]RQR33942.1 hypothetical protein DIE20_29565 [Burkholderia sp. Bp9131]RQR66612.1 hypothetical protein DIE12_31005 [Burkholderia sp. Bp9015]RQS17407.1 hypothetical protein DIE05_37570 [Burkholderia sp. Bp8995]RQS37617.1 hypothetical protein DIE01_22615 [Burkholderia sp. Bp8990]RQS37700.1 hypothetical protein DIE00_37505 [Burkholderia sp. Bp8989]